MKFYYAETSPPCRTIILLADLINIKLELIPTSPKKGETKTPAFLKMNPQHVVPTLVDDDGFVIWESRVIAKYLIAKYGQNDDLYPSDFYKRLDVDKILDFDLGTFFRRSTDYLIPALMTGKFDPSKKPKLDDAFSVFNTILERNKSGYAAADQLTIADISLLTIISSLEIIDYDLKQFPYVYEWLLKIKKEIPSYNTTGVKGEEAFKNMINSSLK